MEYIVCLVVFCVIAYYIFLPFITQLDGAVAWNLLGTLPIVVLNLSSFYLSNSSNVYLLMANFASLFVMLLIVVVNITYLMFAIEKRKIGYIVGYSILSIATGVYWAIQAQVLLVLYLVIFIGSPGR